MEITMTELVLFGTNVVLIALYLHERDESAKHRWFARMMVEKEEFRDQVVGAWEAHRKEKQSATS